VRLADLQPRWIHPNVFVFLCPHCKRTWLSCKNAAMTRRAQFDLFSKELTSEFDRANIVPTKPEFAWSVVGTEFSAMTITPSLDASASGHWHGHITGGQIVGGVQAAET
jgi:Family of unknown function (DUF6527)